MDHAGDDLAILHTLERPGARARFATEVQAELPVRMTAPAFDAALARLTAAGRIVVVAKHPPDPHLADVDLRIVAPADAAAAAEIEDAWRAFLREFLSSHRCS